MSQCNKIHYKPLPTHKKLGYPNLFNSEAPLCACHRLYLKASFTLEAAIIIPLVAGFFASILFFFRVLQVETKVYSALSYASRKTAAIVSDTDSDVTSWIVAQAYFQNAISEEEQISQYVKGGADGISLLNSDFSEDYIDLKASYEIELPIPFFRIRGIGILQQSKSRKWIGDTNHKNDCESLLVYITSQGEVYHNTKTCNYLDLSIQMVNLAEMADLRNENGHKYYACELCAADISCNNHVLITDYGTFYHNDLTCSGLKRTIYEIPKSEVGNRTECSKCKD